MTPRSSVSRIVLLMESVVLATVLLMFSCANSVLWIAWMAEHEDIERWYSHDGSDGRTYVDALLDASESDAMNPASAPASGFIMLLKQLSTFHTMDEEGIATITVSTVRRPDPAADELTMGIRRSIFHPPSVTV